MRSLLAELEGMVRDGKGNRNFLFMLVFFGLGLLLLPDHSFFGVLFTFLILAV